MKTTEQVDKNVPNPTGKGGFGDNPQNRNPGGWKKEESISYQYNRLGRMTDQEFAEYVPQTKFERIAYNRIKDAEDSLNDTKEITDRVEGKAPQSIDMTSNGESINPYAALTTDELRKLAGK